MKRRSSLSALVAGIATVCLSSVALAFQAETPVPATRVERLTYDTMFLSDDLMEGREAGKRGHDFAAQFVAKRFRSLGMMPVSDENEYLQLIPMKVFRTRYHGGVRFTIGADRFEPIVDIVGRTRQQEVMLEDARVVFAGWGLVSDEYKRNDYKKLDVEGAIVVLLQGAPPFLPSDERAYFASRQIEEAAKRGAAAVITVLPPGYEEQIMPFDRYADEFLETQNFAWTGPGGSVAEDPVHGIGHAVMGLDGLRRIFAQEGLEWEKIAPKLVHPKAKVPRFELDVPAKMEMGVWEQSALTPNVVGVIPGRNRMLAGEAIVVTAHLDHRGVQIRDGETFLHSGAIDNASGVALMLEMAQELKKRRLARTVVLAAVTGHEANLQGSDYLAQFRVPGVKKVSAMVNIDSLLTTFPISNLVAFGAEHTNFENVVTGAIAGHNLGIAEDPLPDYYHFTGSDQFSFMKRGIPSIYLAAGIGPEGREPFDTFFQSHHHQPTDVFELIDFEQLERMTAVHVDLVRGMANAGQLLDWDDDSFFAEEFKRADQRADLPQKRRRRGAN
ncbi:MAG: M28 family peptidase [Pseudomonadota bacterium]